MRISDIFLRPVKDEPGKDGSVQGGYTLLEIVVVITLLGLLAGIAAPRLASLYTSVEWAVERDDVLQSIARLGFLAFKEGRGFELRKYPNPMEDSAKPLEDSEKPLYESAGLLQGSEKPSQTPAAPPLDLPSDWSLEADPPIVYKPNGVCMGGNVRLSFKDRSITVYLRPPLGIPEVQ
jgi:general secretion pathway protein G